MEKRIPLHDFKNELRQILAPSVGSDYSWDLVNDNAFVEAVRENVEETSAWRDEWFYTDDDIRLAVGRTLLYKFGILSVLYF